METCGCTIHPLKDGEGNVDLLLTYKSDFQKMVEHKDERVLAAKRKAQEAKDRAASKSHTPGGPSRQTKKKKTAHLSMELSESNAIRLSL
ncbi:hypothetical protein Tco_0865639 [Tanacetum coccineum]